VGYSERRNARGDHVRLAMCEHCSSNRESDARWGGSVDEPAAGRVPSRLLGDGVHPQHREIPSSPNAALTPNVSHEIIKAGFEAPLARSRRDLSATLRASRPDEPDHVTYRPRHTLLVGSLIVLHGMITLLGGAVHALPGCGHDVSAVVAPIGPDGGPSVHSTDPGSADAEQCPFCHYLAQGQVVPEVLEVLSGFLARAHTPCPPLTSLTSQDHDPSRSRAPPANGLG
jgi:hypothetical protein